MKTVPIGQAAFGRAPTQQKIGDRPLAARAPTMLERVREWRQRRRSRAELARLDERLLRDIGITRAEAWLECNKPFWRE